MASPKQELRRTLRKQLAELPPKLFLDEGIRAAEFLDAFPAWREAGTALLFLSAPGEIDTQPLLDLAFKRGKKVFLPRVEGDAARFFRVKSADGPWQTGAFGIREPLLEGSSLPEEFPQPGARGMPGDTPALVVVPGMAFDRHGNRMGHGKGYYDKFFARLDGVGMAYVRVALCLGQQVVPEVPTEPWDKRMDAICTGSGFFSIL